MAMKPKRLQRLSRTRKKIKKPLSQTARQTTFGFYDSGLGGFSAVDACLERYPNAHFIYFADTAYCPLGLKSINVIKQRVQYAMNYLTQLGTHYNFIACNTASIYGVEPGQRDSKIRSTVSALCVEAYNSLSVVKSPSLLLLGTTQTIDSQEYQRRLATVLPGATIKAVAADSFVTAVEAGFDSDARRQVVANALSRSEPSRYDACLLACTHFSFLRAEISQVLGANTSLIEPTAQMFHCLDVQRRQQYQRRFSLIYSGYRPNFEFITYLGEGRISEFYCPVASVSSTTEGIYSCAFS